MQLTVRMRGHNIDDGVRLGLRLVQCQGTRWARCSVPVARESGLGRAVSAREMARSAWSRILLVGRPRPAPGGHSKRPSLRGAGLRRRVGSEARPCRVAAKAWAEIGCSKASSDRCTWQSGQIESRSSPCHRTLDGCLESTGIFRRVHLREGVCKAHAKLFLCHLRSLRAASWAVGILPPLNDRGLCNIGNFPPINHVLDCVWRHLPGALCVLPE